jgi:arylsulfatase A-like enzyme
VRRAAIALAALVAVVAGGLALHRARGRLPAALRVEQPLVDLMTRFDAGTVVAQAPERPVRAARLKLRRHFGQTEGAPRPALLAAPPARLAFRVRVPADAVLAFGVGVDRSGSPARDASGVRFAVLVDGREVWARDVDPAARRRDRRWFDVHLPLAGAPGREAEIALVTTATRPGASLAGEAGWTRLRLVREATRSRQTASAAAPSVVVLLVDTLRADRLGCYGARPSPSPVLDALAARGRLFEQAVAQASWTLPSVTTLLTGLHPRSHGVVGERGGEPASASYLSPGIPTLIEAAADAGVTTVGVTANPLVSPDTNLARGFETFVELPWDDARRSWAPATAVNRAFTAWLARNRGLRFLAYLHYMEPHDPYRPAHPPAPPPGARSAVARGEIAGLARRVNAGTEPPLAPAEVAHLRALYDGEIRLWDAALGDLLATLDRLGVAGTTRIVVVADHGEEFQEHGRLKHRVQLYEEAIHVPLVIAGPGIAPGRVATQVEGIDFFPTVAALLGVPAPAGLPGRNALGGGDERPALVETHHGLARDGAWVDLVALRTPRWKLIHTPARRRWQLYDLAHDPGERTDRWGTAPEGAALAARLAGWQAAPPPAQTVPAAGVTEQLRALGYVE